jgi:hypothetical protein
MMTQLPINLRTNTNCWKITNKSAPLARTKKKKKKINALPPQLKKTTEKETPLETQLSKENRRKRKKKKKDYSEILPLTLIIIHR